MTEFSWRIQAAGTTPLRMRNGGWGAAAFPFTLRGGTDSE